MGQSILTVFEKGGGGMTIAFDYWLPVGGITACPFWGDSEAWCRVTVSSYWLGYRHEEQFGKNATANPLAHEIGHVLGFMDADEAPYLMDGPRHGLDWTHGRDLALKVPERVPAISYESSGRVDRPGRRARARPPAACKQKRKTATRPPPCTKALQIRLDLLI